MAKKSKIKKVWYDVVTPNIFNSVEILETLSDDPRKLEGRKIKVELKKLMPDTDKGYMNIILKIVGVGGNKAKTKLFGHDCSREYLLRLPRKRTDLLNVVENLKTKDGIRVRIKLIAVTLRRIENSTRKEISRKIREILKEEAENKNFDDFMRNIFLNIIQKKILSSVKKIYPLRVLEFKKTEVLS